MPVLTPEGVVGRINRVAGKTLGHPAAGRSALGASTCVMPRTGGRGILRGKSGENGYRCSIEYLARGEQAKEGDAVVTSGAGRRVPARPGGRPRHAQSSRAPSGLYQDVEVTPDVDFARLSEVLVVVAPPPAPDPDAGARTHRPRRARPGGVSLMRSRGHADVALPAADPAVDGAGARARAHGGAQPGPAGRAARRAVAQVDVSSAAVVAFVHRLPVRPGLGRAAGRARLRVRADGAVRAGAGGARGGHAASCSAAATSFVASLLSSLLVVLVRAQVAPEGGYGGLRQAPLEALLTAIVGPLVLSAAPARIDGRIDTRRARASAWRGGPRGGTPWRWPSRC